MLNFPQMDQRHIVAYALVAALLLGAVALLLRLRAARRRTRRDNNRPIRILPKR